MREALASGGFAAEPRPPLIGDAQADVVIVGGGYTGLWTAWFLSERAPGIDVVLLEQDRCGFGPSGRNGGFVTGWWDEADEFVARYGEDAAVRACRALSESIAAIGGWCSGQGVDAWYTKNGWVGVASAAAQEGVWRDGIEVCRRLGRQDEVRELSREEIAEVCRSPLFGSGMFMGDGATVQPARLALGLRGALLDRGVRIHEGTPVRGLSPEREGVGAAVVAETPGGIVRAGRAVVGVGPWASAWPGLGRSVVVRGSYILITAPAPKRLEDIGWTGGEGISDFRTALHYFRTTPDGRIAFGGAGRADWTTRVSARHDFDVRSVQALVRDFGRFFPSFRDVPLEEAWGGPVDVSALHHPTFGTLSPGTIHYSVGYTGNGVGPSHLAGRVLSALATEADDPVTDLPMVNRRSVRFPPAPVSSVGAFVVQAAIARKERAEDDGRKAGSLTRFVASLPQRMGFSLGPKP